jgi:hypothetical protein
MNILHQGIPYTNFADVWNAAVEKMRILQEQEMYEMCVDSTLEDRIHEQHMAQTDDNIMEVYNAI